MAGAGWGWAGACSTGAVGEPAWAGPGPHLPTGAKAHFFCIPCDGWERKLPQPHRGFPDNRRLLLAEAVGLRLAMGLGIAIMHSGQT